VEPITAAILSSLFSTGVSKADEHRKNVQNTSGPTQAGSDGMIHYDPDQAQQIN
jgi:hypothetical protein